MLDIKNQITSRRGMVIVAIALLVVVVAVVAYLNANRPAEKFVSNRKTDLVLTIIDKPTGAFLPGRDIKVEAKVKAQCVDDRCNDTSVWTGITDQQGRFGVPKEIGDADFTLTVQGYKPVDIKGDDKDTRRIDVVE